MKRFLSQVSQQISQRLDEWQDSLETDSRLSVTDFRLPMPKGKKLGIVVGVRCVPSIPADKSEAR